MNKYEQMLVELRREWKAKPALRPIIERRAKAIKRAMEQSGLQTGGIIDKAREIFDTEE